MGNPAEYETCPPSVAATELVAEILSFYLNLVRAAVRALAEMAIAVRFVAATAEAWSVAVASIAPTFEFVDF